MNTPNIKEWEKEYCKEFGLCKEGEKCQCKAELKFIRKILQDRDAELVERIRAKKKALVLCGMKCTCGKFNDFTKTAREHLSEVIKLIKDL